MILDIPDIRQSRDYDCGAACIDAVAAYYQLRLRTALRLANPVQGMAPDTVAAALRSLGLRVLAGQMLGGLADLRHYTRSGFPVLCPVTLEDGHWVVVVGVSRGRVHYHDPAAGMSVMSGERWLERWYDESGETHQEFRSWGVVVGC